jgi:hypothetical protein
MAISTVSSISDDVWQLIATNTPSAASSSSFTSISGYKKLMVTWQLTGVTGYLGARFNNDTTSGNHAGSADMFGAYGERFYTTFLPINAYIDSDTGGYATFKDTDKTTPKFIDEIGGRSGTKAGGIYFGTSAVTQLDVVVTTGTFSGTIKLYGIAA